MDQWRTFGQLSEAISTAAADPDAWPAFLELLATAVGSNSIGLHWEQMDSARHGNIAYRHGLAATFTEDYERYYGPRNPIVARAGALMVPGRALLRQEVCREDTFRSSEFYNDFLKPNDILHILGGTIAHRGPSTCLISVCGSHRRKAFELKDAHLLEALIPHMRTTLLLQNRLGALEQRLARVETAFDTNPDAAALVDERSSCADSQ
jgi:hypothetical protein